MGHARWHKGKGMELSISEQRLLKGVEKTQRRIFLVVFLIVAIVYILGLGAWCAWKAHHFYREHNQAAAALKTMFTNISSNSIYSMKVL